MSWAGRRRILIASIVGAFLLSVFVSVLIASIYKTPTCTDGIQNQDENGVDCGGVCPILCTPLQRAPITLFVRPLMSTENRVDIIASILNQNNFAASSNVPYKITLYDLNRRPLKSINGLLDLPAGGDKEGGRVFVYIPDVFKSTPTAVASASLEIIPESVTWVHAQPNTRNIPQVRNYVVTKELVAPRIDVTFSNSSPKTLVDTKVIIIALDAEGNAIAASQTIIPTIPAFGDAPAIFTWAKPFSAPIATIEIQPVIPLP